MNNIASNFLKLTIYYDFIPYVAVFLAEMEK